MLCHAMKSKFFICDFDSMLLCSLDYAKWNCKQICTSTIRAWLIYQRRIVGLQGRGPKTHAYTHSLETNHHMFMKLEDGRVYCLPDGYEVIDRSLDIIRFVLNPTFAPQEVV